MSLDCYFFHLFSKISHFRPIWKVAKTIRKMYGIFEDGKRKVNVSPSRQHSPSTSSPPASLLLPPNRRPPPGPPPARRTPAVPSPRQFASPARAPDAWDRTPTSGWIWDWKQGNRCIQWTIHVKSTSKSTWFASGKIGVMIRKYGKV